jgi:hypothetical protein
VKSKNDGCASRSYLKTNVDSLRSKNGPGGVLVFMRTDTQSGTRQVKKRGKTPTRPNTPNGSKTTTCSPRSQNAKGNADVSFTDRARIASHSKREWRASERAKKEEASDV